MRILLLALALPQNGLMAQEGRIGNPLRMPAAWSGGSLTAAPTNVAIWPGFSTAVLAINGAVPSPTIRVTRGSNFTARVENRLTNALVMHWHGIVAPANMDGHPKDAVAPGQSYSVDFPVRQRAGTYFYHPHTEPLTGQLVYRGLAGAYIVEDPTEVSLGLPSGDRDVPLLIQDKQMRTDRQLVYAPTMMETMTGFLGNVVLVNGTPDAYLSVETSLYRFRLINGSNARVYKVAFSDDRAFHLIGTDAGLIAAPVQATSVFVAPGERVELLVDFRTNKIGDSVTLRSLEFDAAGMGMGGGHEHHSGMDSMDGLTTSKGADMPMETETAPNVAGMAIDGMPSEMSSHVISAGSDAGHMISTSMISTSMMSTSMMSTSMMATNMMATNMMAQGAAMDIIKFYVDRQGAGTNGIPTTLATIQRHDHAQSRRTRTFILGMTGMVHTINDAAFNMTRTDFTVPFGELEKWEFRNMTDEIHPMHPHGALFQVLDRNGDTNLPPENLGWKDTVLVWPGETVRVLIRFDAYAGVFVSHCHNLEHEDSGMMQNFEVLPARLGITIQTDRLALSYPAIATEYFIESTSSLAAPESWSRVTEPASIQGDTATVTLMPTSGNRFYRLVRPLLQPTQSGGGDPHAGHH